MTPPRLDPAVSAQRRETARILAQVRKLAAELSGHLGELDDLIGHDEIDEHGKEPERDDYGGA